MCFWCVCVAIRRAGHPYEVLRGGSLHLLLHALFYFVCVLETGIIGLSFTQIDFTYLMYFGAHGVAFGAPFLPDLVFRMLCLLSLRLHGSRSPDSRSNLDVTWMALGYVTGASRVSPRCLLDLTGCSLTWGHNVGH